MFSVVSLEPSTIKILKTKKSHIPYSVIIVNLGSISLSYEMSVSLLDWKRSNQKRRRKRRSRKKKKLSLSFSFILSLSSHSVEILVYKEMAILLWNQVFLFLISIMRCTKLHVAIGAVELLFQRLNFQDPDLSYFFKN